MTTPAPVPSTGEALLSISPVMPVVVVDDAEQAVPMARALSRGGIGIVEVTLRTAAGLAAIERIAADVPEVVVGAGTVTTPHQARDAARAGARFIVTPGSPDALLAAVLGNGLPVLAGAATITEIMRLVEYGQRAVKFFPAEAAGGTAYLKAVAGPLPDVQFCPTGGISVANAASYLELENVGCVGGSWLTPRDVLRTGDWERVERLAAAAVALRR